MKAKVEMKHPLLIIFAQMAVLTSFPQMFIVLGMYNFGCRIDNCKQTKKYWTFQRHCQGSRSVTTKEADHSTSSTLLTENRHRSYPTLHTAGFIHELYFLFGGRAREIKILLFLIDSHACLLWSLLSEITFSYITKS